MWKFKEKNVKFCDVFWNNSKKCDLRFLYIWLSTIIDLFFVFVQSRFYSCTLYVCISFWRKMSLPIDIRNYVSGIINDCLNLLQSNVDAAFLRPYLWPLLYSVFNIWCLSSGEVKKGWANMQISFDWINRT